MSKRCAAIFSALTILFGAISFENVHADDPVTASSVFSIDVSNAVLQVTADETAHIDLNPITSAAVFNSTDVIVNVATNNSTGYTMTMDVATTNLTHTTITGENAPIIPTLQSISTQSNFPANAWGYKATGDSYKPILLSNSNPTWQVYSPTNGTNHTITLGASVDGSKESGTYTNTLTFSVVANAVVTRDTVVFDGNGADTGDMFDDGFSITSGSTIQLPINKYSKTNYRFIGWNTSQNGLGTSYADQGEYAATAVGQSQNITLYAMWSNLPPDSSTSGTTPSGLPGITISRAYEIAYTAAHKGMWEKNVDGNGYTQVTDGVYHNRDVRWDMQGMTPEICNSVTAIEDDYEALDIRDWKLYHITKLQDGHCWMTQNLDLDLSTSITLTHSDTDLGYTTNDPNAQWTPGHNTMTFSGTSINWENEFNSSLSADSGDIYYISSNSSYTDTIATSLSNCKAQSQSYTDSFCAHYHAGNYYNWAAAIATDDVSSISFADDNGSNAPNSICPAGWRLPNGTRDVTGDSIEQNVSEFNILLKKYGVVNGFSYSGSLQYASGGFSKIRSAPLYFVRSGYTDNRMAQSSRGLIVRGIWAHYWSRTTYYDTDSLSENLRRHAWTMAFYEGNVSPSNGDTRSYGFEIRCLAR